MFTISTITISTNNRFQRNRFDYACITLPNGAKCNPTFFWECVRLGILSPDD